MTDSKETDPISREVCTMRHGELNRRLDRLEARLNTMVTIFTSAALGLLIFVGKEIFKRAFGG